MVSMMIGQGFWMTIKTSTFYQGRTFMRRKRLAILIICRATSTWMVPRRAFHILGRMLAPIRWRLLLLLFP
jgi:hypothetical protein